jgi:hypothetical protein
VLAPFVVVVVAAPVRDRLDAAGMRRRTLPVTVRGIVLVLVSLAVGAATHTLWDAFTHAWSWGPRHIGWLADRHAGLPGYQWAQYGSGILGAVSIAAWLARWWRTHLAVSRSAPGPPAWTVWTAWIVIVVAGVVGGLVAALPLLNDDGLRRTVFLTGTGAAGAGLIAAVLYAGCWAALSRHG